MIISDLDFIFISYDEPKKEEFYKHNLSIITNLKRVDGIKGIDAAHKQAAKISNTDWFVVIDGDNIVNSTILTASIDTNSYWKCFRYRSKNNINGVISGNGGISCWSKEFVLSMNTHESSNSESTKIEFGSQCKPTAGIYSVTYTDGSPYHAWRAGFREAVKLCLNTEIKQNKKNLSLWHNIGRDVQNGFWSIYGARLGTYMTRFENLDLAIINDYDKLQNLWSEIIYSANEDRCKELGIKIKESLDLDIVEYDSLGSQFFKKFLQNEL